MALSDLFSRLFRTGRAAAAGTDLITGVVGPHGAAGVRGGPDQPWMLRFVLDSWRVTGAQIRDSPLVVSRACPAEQLPAFRARLKPYQVIVARVRLDGFTAAELVELVDGVDDAEMAARAAELSARPTREDPRFGTLTLDRRLGAYAGTVEWAGATIELQLEAADDEQLDDALRTAYALWDAQDGWSERIQAYAVQELLPVKNESWLDDDEDPLSPAEFRARMRLTTIDASPEGEFVFWHNDGELFWGHTIQVAGNLAEGPVDADIPG